MNRLVLCGVGMSLALAGVAQASEIYGVTSFGSGKQIWIKAGAFDSRDPGKHFVNDASLAAKSLSGGAYAFIVDWDSRSDTTDQQDWWAEYTIDASKLPGVNLSGKWRFWGRTGQPLATGGNDFYYNDSNYLFVKGQDGTGATWYNDALANKSNADDRISNDVFFDPNGNVPQGIGDFKWYSSGNGTTPEYIDKTFTLDNNQITFRIYEREANPMNARLDMLVFTSDLSYVPTDADFRSIPEPAMVGLLLPLLLLGRRTRR